MQICNQICMCGAAKLILVLEGTTDQGAKLERMFSNRVLRDAKS